MVAALAGTSGCGSAAAGRQQPLHRVASSAPSHAALIVMENKEADAVLGSRSAPFTNRLAGRYAVATRSYGVTHPSLPNYLALTSGATHGIRSDCTACHVAARNLVDQLEDAGVSWKAYLEGAPRPCFTGTGSGGYAKRHNPFVYYDDVAQDAARCRRLVPSSELTGDLRRGDLPAFAWITPDLCDDTHDCGVASGDRFLAHLVPRLLAGIGDHGFVVITWDEGSSSAGCCGDAAGGHIVTLVAGPAVRRGARLARPIDHYGVLRTVEQRLGLPLLGAARDPRNGSLAPLFAGKRP